MNKEAPGKTEAAPQKLPPNTILKILEKYPGVRLDSEDIESVQHFVVEGKNKEGHPIQHYIPIWKEIPRKGEDPLTVEEAILKALKE